MRILLLNPPGRRLFLRDYYCSTVSKSGYLWHPIDLLVQSGYLARVGDVDFIDGIAEKLSVEAALQRVKQIGPDVVFSLVGAQSADADLAFLRTVSSQLPDVRLAISGEPLLEEPEALLAKAPWVAVGVRNFTTPKLAEWVAQGAPREPQRVLGERFALQGKGVRLDYPVPVH